jgi:dephospho-CoA kinase
MFNGKPIIGIVGGIGSGKSFIAGLFGELGCVVIDSDAQVRAAYEQPAVRQTLREWWGEGVFRADGSIDRRAIAARVFTDPRERGRLEGLIHPLVREARLAEMKKYASDPQCLAFVWDTPLLFETGSNRECDVVVFVDAPLDLRLERVGRGRRWEAAELHRRENLQWPLDRKREMSDIVLRNAADVGEARGQVRDVFSRILK